MPFSWKKKTRCTRFSQLVADHLQSPKHGGSLVVETGFPTSLIDLYVRNRGRFRKSSAKKQRGNDSPTPLSSSSDSLVDSNNLSSGVSDYRGSDEIIEEDVVSGGGMVVSGSNIEIDDSSITEVERSVEMAKLNPVVAAALKVLFVVVLILGTKRFKFGITVSAFLLFFLELVGKPLLGRSSLTRPGVDSKTLFESSPHGTKNIKDSKENATLFVCSEVVEIEEQVDSQEEARSKKELDEVRSEVLMEVRHKSSRKALMKSRMKKLVPKKLRKSSMGSKGEISCGLKEEETVKRAQDLNPLVFSSEYSESKLKILCASKQEPNKIVEIEGPSSSSTLLSETDCSNKKLGKESQQNYGCLVLCLIVLIGLIGGRVLALVLALSWCFIQKKSHGEM
ncbi:uncharacterized protein LOC112518316 [Cynara cardunculus var. scolymus]|uniref:uncharacterized protein LOC112518316 n=1 Tax=Cynara cardunculus var. scolymus TaxID=59895 RepID=UPI000D6249F3|nr:uncharacterized protein LOC112518316 [Cynara cardunculus var. scolymus]